MKQSKIFFNILWSYAEKFLSKIISLLVQIVLARLLLPSEYGSIAIILVMISLFDILLNDGFCNALVQKEYVDEYDFHSVFVVNMIVSLFLYCIIFFISDSIGVFFDDDSLPALLRFLSLVLIISAFNSVQKAYIQRHLLFKKYFLATIGSNVFSGIIGIVYAYKGFGVWSLAYQYVTGVAVNAIIIFFQITWKPKLSMSITKIKEMFSFGFTMILSAFSYTFKDNVRQLVIGKCFSSYDLGVYNQGLRFPSLLVGDMIASLGQVIFPVLSREQCNKVIVKEMTRKAIACSSFIFLPIILGLYAVSDNFIIVLLTDKWLDSAIYLRIMCIAFFNRSFSMIAMKCILALGKSKENFFHDIIVTISTVLCIFVSVFYFESIEFVAWSYVMVAFIDTIIFVYYLKKFINYKILEMCMDYVPYFMLSLFASIFAYFIGDYIETRSICLLIQVFSEIIIYLLLAKAFRLNAYNELINRILLRDSVRTSRLG